VGTAARPTEFREKQNPATLIFLSCFHWRAVKREVSS
jgi:hypothetical protein